MIYTTGQTLRSWATKEPQAKLPGFCDGRMPAF
jgi:hypothetical protein